MTSQDPWQPWQPWQLRVLGHSGIAKLPPESLQGLAKVGNSRDMALEAPHTFTEFHSGTASDEMTTWILNGF
jgi:hypothetical protein